MYGYHQPTTFFQHPGASSVSSPVHFRSQDITLTLRQQPKEALVTTEGKEKARKPVDPPPIIQLNVKSTADPQQNFLQSPYLFMCTSLYKADKEQSFEGNASKSLAGSLVSSLHRLKDVDNKDGAFFVFGDISVKVQGTFRLHFSLFDLHKETNEVQYLGGITSDPFKVLLPKDFKGMDESTYLSRAFSDQGVRLRLRKEPRAMIGNKRPYPYGAETPTSNTPIRPNMHEYSSSYSEPTTSPNKRFRSETDDVKREAYQDHTSLSASTFSPNYSTSQYQARPPTMSTPYSMGQQYPGFGAALTTGSTTPYQFRAGMGSSMGLGDSLLPTSTDNITGTLATQQSFTQLYPNYAPQRSAPSMFPNFSQ